MASLPKILLLIIHDLDKTKVLLLITFILIILVLLIDICSLRSSISSTINSLSQILILRFWVHLLPIYIFPIIFTTIDVLNTIHLCDVLLLTFSILLLIILRLLMSLIIFLFQSVHEFSMKLSLHFF